MADDPWDKPRDEKPDRAPAFFAGIQVGCVLSVLLLGAAIAGDLITHGSIGWSIVLAPMLALGTLFLGLVSAAIGRIAPDAPNADTPSTSRDSRVAATFRTALAGFLATGAVAGFVFIGRAPVDALIELWLFEFLWLVGVVIVVARLATPAVARGMLAWALAFIVAEAWFAWAFN